MWIEFLLAACMTLILIYGPGFLFFRGIRFSGALSFFCAPLYSIAAYVALPILYAPLALPCSVATVVGPTALVAALMFVRAQTQSRSNSAGLELNPVCPLHVRSRTIPIDLVGPIAYVIAASLVCYFVFIRALPEAGAILQRHDNQTHLNLVRAFLDSRTWSSLHNNVFLASPAYAVPFAKTGGFYPCAWACVVVLTCLTSGVDLMISVNAVVTVITCVVFPLGMYAFFRVLLPQRRRTILLGAIAITGFVNWPWFYIYTGPLYPNELGIALQFGALAVLMLLIERAWHIEQPVHFVAFCVIAFLALGLSHPSAIFSSYVFMACYGAHVLANAYTGRRRAFVLAGYTVTIVAFWICCYRIPALGRVISYDEHEQANLGDAIISLLNMSFVTANTQYVIVFCSLLGSVALFRQQKRRWLLLPVAFFALGYVATRIDWGFVEHWISALWYSDSRRMASNMTLYLMPVVAIGLDTLLPSPEDDAEHRQDTKVRLRQALCVALVMGIFFPSIRLPQASIRIETPFGIMAAKLHDRYRETIYAPEEIAFVNRALEVIPADSLVINTPADGSLWAYGVNGLNTYYRSITYERQTPEAELIRIRLNDYASDPKVRDAVAHVGATYVLQLDRGVSFEDGAWIWQVSERHLHAWRGVSAIGDETPGFSVVLAEGSEMRLYRIDAA